MVDCGGLPLPGSAAATACRGGAHAAARLIAAQRPDVIEAGDPYRLAWAALDAARRCGVPAVAVLPQRRRHAGRAHHRAPRAARRAIARTAWRAAPAARRPLCEPPVRPPSTSCWRRAAAMQQRLLRSGVMARAVPAAGRRHAVFQPARARRALARVARAAGRRARCCCTPAASRRRKTCSSWPRRSQRLGPALPPACARRRARCRRAASRCMCWPSNADRARGARHGQRRRASCMPATRRPAGWPCSRPWPAARRWSCATPAGWARRWRGGCGFAVDVGPRRRLGRGDRRSCSVRRAPACSRRCARARGHDWPRVLARCSAATRAMRSRAVAPPSERRCERGRRSASAERQCAALDSSGGADSGYAMSVTLHDVAPATQARCERLIGALRAHCAAAVHAAGGALLPRAARRRRVRATGSTRAARRRRAGAARPDPPRRRRAAAAWFDQRAPTLVHRRRRRVRRRSTTTEATAPLQRRAPLVRAPRAGRCAASSRRPGCSARAPGARCAASPSTTPARAPPCSRCLGWPTSRCRWLARRAASCTARAPRGAARLSLPMEPRSSQASRAPRRWMRFELHPSDVEHRRRARARRLRLVERAVARGREPLTLAPWPSGCATTRCASCLTAVDTSTAPR